MAAAGYRPRRGEKILSVGCDWGGDPTVRRSYVTATDKISEPPTVQVAGQPVEGRSGGGLFNAQGMVIGVCYAADPQDNEGLYASLASIWGELDRRGLSFVYDRSAGDGSIEHRHCLRELELARATYRANRTMNFFVDETDGHDDYLMSLALLVEAGADAAPRAARGRVREERHAW